MRRKGKKEEKEKEVKVRASAKGEALKGEEETEPREEFVNDATLKNIGTTTEAEASLPP